MLQKQQKSPTGNMQEAFRTTIFEELNSVFIKKSTPKLNFDR